MVTIKVECTSNKEGKVTFCPVYSGSKENERAFRMTPSGRIEFQVLNELAAMQLVPGNEYLVDIRPVE